MKLIYTVALFFVFWGNITAQQADFYVARMPSQASSNYLIYKPDSTLADVLKYDNELTASAVWPAIQNYGERVVLMDADTFTIETDRTTALYFKAKNGKKEIFLQKYLNEEKCWDKGAVVYAKVDETDKNSIRIYLTNTKGRQFMKNGEQVVCGMDIKQLNVPEYYFMAMGKKAPGEMELIAAKVNVYQENKVLIINMPREAFSKFVAYNFWLYDAKGTEVKDFLNIKATENVLYINDLPKGKYSYKLEAYDGTPIHKGTVNIVKVKKK